MKNILFYALLTLFVASCSHVNNLKPKELNEKKILYNFKEINPGNVVVDLGPDYHPRRSDNLIAKAADLVTGIAKNIGTAYTANNLEDKLNQASKEINFRSIFSDNMATMLKQYTKAEKVNNINDEYNYIANINLENHTITANNLGVNLYMEVYVELNERFTARKVWSQRESQSVQLDFETTDLDIINSKTADFIRLLNMNLITDDRMLNALKHAANNISKDLNNKLIEDIRTSN